MRKGNSFYDTIDHIISYGVHKGILHLHNEEESFNGNHIILKGKNVVNFGSCSYLGLEFDERLKQAAKEAIDRYGTQFSESRAYVSLKLYNELESLFEKIFDGFCVVAPTTTLGHIATIPVIIQDEDAVIIDHQVHNSVQTAASLLKSRNVYIELLRHNRMDLLEERIKFLRSKYHKIWYLADGIYSMYGDGSPVNEIYNLMGIYSELHYYVDDAHGMSVFGKNGRGYVLNEKGQHPKMVVATSLAKAFATGGAVMVFPNAELARKVRTCGAPLITSGPMQPAALGAAIAAARIHLSPEIYEMQKELKEKTKFTREMLEKYGLPVISSSEASVFFVGVSLPKLGYNMVKRMIDAGFYVNLGIFPAVPMKNTGIRFTITRLHSFSQIEAMVKMMAFELPKALKQENVSVEEIYKAFKIPVPLNVLINKALNSSIVQTSGLKLFHYTIIKEIQKEEWNEIFENKGTFDWDGLATLEACFNNNELPENNWLFDYVLIKDLNGKIIVATFLTTALWKDDMLSPCDVSKQVEEKRLFNKYYLTSKVISTGSLLTEGEHLYINKNSPLWKDAVQLLLEKIYSLQETNNANNIVLRDFHCIDETLDSMMIDNGFFRISMPDTNIKEDMNWKCKEEFYLSLSERSRQHFREDVRKHENKFQIKIVSETPSDEDINYWYQLYLNVKNHSYDLNTFTLPKKLFYHLLNNKNWEVILLQLKNENEHSLNMPVCIVFCYKTKDNYVPMIIGLDYTLNADYKIYRQALYQMVLRAKALGKKKIYFGFAASIEKKKMGAKPLKIFAYMHSKDSYNMEVLAGMKEGKSAHFKQIK